MGFITRFMEQKLITGIVITLLGAGGIYVAMDTPQEEVKNVSYYNEHTDERSQKIAFCKDSPGTATNDPNCTNAAASEAREMLGANNSKTPRITRQSLQRGWEKE